MTATHSCDSCSMKETCQNEELNIRAIVPRNRFLAMEMNGDWDAIDKREKLLNDFEEVIRREERSRYEKELKEIQRKFCLNQRCYFRVDGENERNICRNINPCGDFERVFGGEQK